MRKIYTITANDMRGINRSAIIELARRAGRISRTEIAARLNVSLPTVMRIVDELLEEELLRPTGDKSWSGGRKREVLEFNASGHVVIGVDLGGTKVYGAVSDLGGNILNEIHVPQHNTREEESFHMLVNMIKQLQQAAAGSGAHLMGIGIGVPGVIIPESGRMMLAPALNWTGFPLRERLQAHFDIPVDIENDVRLAALGESWFGAGSEADSLVLIAIGTGIGSGIVVNSIVFPGANNIAGEIGYLLPDRTHLGKRYDQFGAFEQCASGTGITERARRLLDGLRSQEELSSLSAVDVFSAARRGENWAQRVVSETVDYLAQAIASIQLILDPELIVLGGGVSASADLLVEPILARLAGAIPTQPNVRVSHLGYRAGVMGSVVKLLQITANYYRVEKYD
ncbi:MAG TPA: ROK family transcriptional regulator [Levilinea sp.]|nr:ROK family transcriptional regulator [Levilinea sp.]